MKIAIIGRGNVATHLYKALEDVADVQMVNPHTLEDLPSAPELILISVKDDAIEKVMDKLPETSAVIAHTAGSVPLDILKKNNNSIGVFYPLQTFTKDVDLNYSEIPVFIEGDTRETVERLTKVAELFTNNIHLADSDKRKKLHLASVFACNFTNALIGIADSILKESEMDSAVIRPLLRQTINKLNIMSPADAQTGPAKRKDKKVIDEHLRMLETNPKLKNIYQQLTDFIQNEPS